ncbi:MAG: hypothetical protein LAT51_08020 [Flavobacteriaceae bacterium]|nr:hypothetical protein [Flavobacteriaceae bacterium]
MQELYYTVKRRNEFIHPSTKEFEGRLKEECGKIYTSEGYLTLLQQIHELTRKITE